MLKGFKEFVLRGNVVDLAIAVVIGAAFGAVVSAFVSKIVTPIINALPGGNSQGLGFSLRHGAKFEDAKTGLNTTFVDISGIINAIIVFIVTAAVVYFVFVLPMNKLAERRRRGEEVAEAAKAEDVILLEEIRDLLRAGQQRA
jgi:large conductance mechanosensitive channel